MSFGENASQGGSRGIHVTSAVCSPMGEMASDAYWERSKWGNHARGALKTIVVPSRKLPDLCDSTFAMVSLSHKTLYMSMASFGYCKDTCCRALRLLVHQLVLASSTGISTNAKLTPCVSVRAQAFSSIHLQCIIEEAEVRLRTVRDVNVVSDVVISNTALLLHHHQHSVSDKAHLS